MEVTTMMSATEFSDDWDANETTAQDALARAPMSEMKLVTDADREVRAFTSLVGNSESRIFAFLSH